MEPGHVVQRLPQSLWGVGVDGLIPDLPAAEASGEGLGKEVWPFVIGPLRFASVTSWAWQMFKVTIFLKGALVGSSEAPFWGQLSFPPQGKSSPPSGCQCFPWQPWLSGDHLCVEFWTGLISGSILVCSCLDHTWSRKSLCSFFPQCWHKHSFLPVSFFSLYLSSVDITSHACFQVCQAQGTQAKIKGESLEGPSLTLGRMWCGPMEYRSPN